MTPANGEMRPPHGRTLLFTAVLAIIMHSLALSGFHREAPSADPPAARDQGIAIDFAPQSARGSGTQVDQEAQPAKQESAFIPAIAPSPKSEKLSPLRPRLQRQATAAKKTPSEQKADEGAHASPPVYSRSSTSPVGLSSPEPLSSYSNPKPVYPALARKRGQEGLVRLLAHVDEKGGLTDLAVAQSSGYPMLDEAALKAVRKWRFTPGLRNGTPVKGIVVIPVEFQLREIRSGNKEQHTP